MDTILSEKSLAFAVIRLESPINQDMIRHLEKIEEVKFVNQIVIDALY